MRFPQLFTLAAAVSAVRALTLSAGVLKTPAGDQQFAVQSPAAQPVLFDSAESKVEISFDLSGLKRIPDQIFVKLTTASGVETSLKPITRVATDAFTNKLTLSYTKLPKVFTASKQIYLSLVAGDVSDSQPINAPIGTIELTDSLIEQSKYTASDKFGPKPEIHHIFQTAPKTVNPVVALTFASLSIACLVLLLAAWASQGALNFKNFPGMQISHVAFILSILAYEVIFFQYYLGCTIFQTIARVLILLGPSVWWGARVLNYVGALRLAGDR